jgi:hypothetical protein
MKGQICHEEKCQAPVADDIKLFLNFISIAVRHITLSVFLKRGVTKCVNISTDFSRSTFMLQKDNSARG